MFKIEWKNTDKQIVEVLPVNGIYTTYELGQYRLSYKSDNLTRDIYIEDEVIDYQYIYIDNKTTSTTWGQFFVDHFGYCRITINNETFTVNILCEKLKTVEIEKIILYLYENNHNVLNKFMSKSSISGTDIINGKEYSYSSKYINLIQKYIKIFSELYPHFVSMPSSKIKREYTLSDYSSQTIDSKSIEWIFQNLDSISFSYENKNHPDAVEICGQYGLIEKIGAEESTTTLQTYENEIIIGSFQYVRSVINDIRSIIQSKINNQSDYKSSKTETHADFQDLKRIPFIRFLSELENTEHEFNSIHKMYSMFFENAKPRNEYPKLTPIFSNYKHYQKAFETIILFRNSKYEPAGEIQLLNIRKLSELYELYNMNIITSLLMSIINYDKVDITYNEDSQTTKKISFILTDRRIVNFYYEPTITSVSRETKLITVGNSKLVSKYCNPDFVIEIVEDNKPRYCILDAKYSKILTVKNIHATSCIKKYIIDIGIEGERYQKPDYLILLHPDDTDSEEYTIYNQKHFPQILTIISKPDYITSLEKTILTFLLNKNSPY